MSDRPPERDMYGQPLAAKYGRQIFNARLVTDPVEQRALDEFRRYCLDFEAQFEEPPK